MVEVGDVYQYKGGRGECMSTGETYDDAGLRAC